MEKAFTPQCVLTVFPDVARWRRHYTAMCPYSVSCCSEMEKALHRYVSIQCTDGTLYQGRVEAVDQTSQSVTLGSTIRNGVPVAEKHVAIISSAISDIQFLPPPSHAQPSQSDSRPSRATPGATKNKKLTQRQRSNSFSSGQDRKSDKSTPKKDHRTSYRNGLTFDMPVNNFSDDFDFEENLALFDKAQVFSDIDHGNTPKPMKKTNKPAKFRHDEMILTTTPVKSNGQTDSTSIQLPPKSSGGCTYMTDSGLTVPSIQLSLRDRLLTEAVKSGVSEERIVDSVGRSATEMVLQLLGGNTRITPNNAHQSPHVIAFCGPHFQGALGMNCARHLTNHGVTVTLVTPKLCKVKPIIESELALFKKTDNQVVYDVAGVSRLKQHVDMIVNCMESHESRQMRSVEWYSSGLTWIKDNGAPILSIDPPCEDSFVSSDWVLGLGLPLSYTGGDKFYLCDLGFPKQVYTSVLPSYTSPFGAKFCIPLYQS